MASLHSCEKTFLMVPSSGTNISSDEGLDSLNRKPITINVTKDRINAPRTGNIAP